MMAGESKGNNDPQNARDWCRSIIEGSGGMNDFERHEVVVWQDGDRVCGAHWALRCLANPDCAGSQKVLDEIIKAREEAAISKATGEAGA